MASQCGIRGYLHPGSYTTMCHSNTRTYRKQGKDLDVDSGGVEHDCREREAVELDIATQGRVNGAFEEIREVDNCAEADLVLGRHLGEPPALEEELGADLVGVTLFNDLGQG